MGIVILICLIAIVVFASILSIDNNMTKEKEQRVTTVDDPIHPNQKITQYDLVERYKIDGTIYCPQCYSINVACIGQTLHGVRPQKTKTEVSLNLNPLKPFTLFNEKTKVVDKGSAGYTITKWQCMNCGTTFNR